MSLANWYRLGDAVDAATKQPGDDLLQPYREEAYATSIPWGRCDALRNRWNVAALFKSMAETLNTEDQLSRLFVLMDEARSAGHMPEATADAGDVLIERARGSRKLAPLPDDWVSRAYTAHDRGPKSSGAFWAGAMLRAAGHEAPVVDLDEVGPQAKGGGELGL